MTPDYYYYLNQSDTYKVDGTDDRSDFSETLVSTNRHFSPQETFIFILFFFFGEPLAKSGYFFKFY